MPVGMYALVSGLVFGAGLTISRMIDPSKVIGFLDVTGNWDPSLAFVMGGALVVAIPTFALAKKRETTLTGLSFDRPSKSGIDAALIFGSVLFGVGWGLGGFCPGPGLSAMAFGLAKPMIFVGSMVVGMIGFGVIRKFSSQST